MTKKQISKTEFIQRYAKAAKLAFYNWKPYDYQVKVFEDLFMGNKKYVMCEWARGSGKTQVGLTFAILSCLLYPKSSSIYIAPTEKDAKDILRDKVLQTVNPDLILRGKPAMGEGTINFKNGSCLYIRGALGKHRGKEPVAVVYDEFADFDANFHSSFSPTMRLDHCRLLIIGTPPYLQDVESGRSDHYDEMIKVCTSNEKKYSFYQINCWEGNPLFQEFYKTEEEQYTLRGDYDSFRTEYLLERTRRRKQAALLADLDSSYLMPHYSVKTFLKTTGQ